jgi:hypothetical protein
LFSIETTDVYFFKKGKTRKGKIESFNINPKSITIDELYGKSDPNTFEWTDGLLGNAIRQFTNQNNNSDNIEVLYLNI